MCQMSDLNHFGQEKSCKHHVNLLEAAKDLAHLTPHPHTPPPPPPPRPHSLYRCYLKLPTNTNTLEHYSCHLLINHCVS